MEGLTDDRKVHRPARAGGASGAAEGAAACGAAAAAVRLSRRELRTLAAAALSPAATLMMLQSPLPHAFVRCVTGIKCLIYFSILR